MTCGSRFSVLAVLLMGGFVLGGCGGDPGVIPFQSGDYLEYLDVKNTRSAYQNERYEFDRAPSGALRIRKLMKEYVNGSEHGAELYETYEVDVTGKVLSAEKEDLRVGRQIFLWLPENKRRDGAGFAISAAGSNPVRADEWDGRPVFTYHSRGADYFYDRDTGILIRTVIGDAADERLDRSSRFGTYTNH